MHRFYVSYTEQAIKPDSARGVLLRFDMALGTGRLHATCSSHGLILHFQK